ncbi:MAG: DinB family protein [Ginsengibacter sp.]
MDNTIEIIRVTRNNFLRLMNDLTIEELNKIPKGFNNNIIWNFGHVIVSQQIICYKLSNQPLKVSDEYVNKYAKGTRPGEFVDQQQFDDLKALSIDLINQLQEDVKEDLFANYTCYKTMFGFELTNIDDAIKYVSSHEGLHLGYAMALKKAIKL